MRSSATPQGPCDDCDGLAAFRDDNPFPSLGPAQVLAKPILDLSDSDRNHWASHVATISNFVATLSSDVATHTQASRGYIALGNAKQT